MMAILAALVLLPTLLVVAVLQQVGIYAELPEEPDAPVMQARTSEDPALLMAQLFTKLREAWPAMAGGGEPMNSMDSQWLEHEDTPETDKARDWMAALDARRYQLEAAIVAGEFVGPGEAVDRLDQLTQRLGEDLDRVEQLQAAAATRSGGADAGGGGGDEPQGDPRVAGTDAAPGRGASQASSPDRGDDLAGMFGPDLDEALRRASKFLPVLLEDTRLLRAHFAAMEPREADQTGGRAGGEPDAPADTRPSPSPIERGEGGWDAFKERHGWYADLVRVIGAPSSDPDRAALLEGGQALVVFLLAVAGGLGVVALASVGASIWAIIMLCVGGLRPWFVPPVPGGSVYLETVVLFVLSFLGVQVLGGLLASIPGLEGYSIEINIGCQWLVLSVVFWPLVRGVGVARWRRDLGLIAPRGVLREVGAGLAVYFAGLPLLVGLGLLGAVVLKPLWDDALEEHVPYTTGGNPVLELVTSGGALQLVLVYTLATVWAPIVEEIIFRGCLYRHLRSRLPLVLAGPLSALAFGLMHGYELVLLGPVIALGFTFACMREWRGSLVGAITMHAVHNGTVLLMLIIMMRLVD